jgi:site-specific DNA-adenine methylase
MSVVPPFAYYGGKAGPAGQIVDLMPPHSVRASPPFRPVPSLVLDVTPPN